MHRLLSVVLLSSSAFAATATFSFNGTATGTLGSTPFTNAAFTVSAPGDFTTVSCSAGTCRLNVAAGAATYTIGGVGTGTFSGTAYFFDNQTSTFLGTPAGFGRFRYHRRPDSDLREHNWEFRFRHLQPPVGDRPSRSAGREYRCGISGLYWRSYIWRCFNCDSVE